jgi:hypothetical protein
MTQRKRAIKETVKIQEAKIVTLASLTFASLRALKLIMGIILKKRCFLSLSNIKL